MSVGAVVIEVAHDDVGRARVVNWREKAKLVGAARTDVGRR